MAENNNSNASGGIGCLGLLAVLLTVLFVGLKLTGFIAWSWFWVVSPIPIAIVLSIGLFILVVGGVFGFIGAVAGVAALLDRRDKNKQVHGRDGFAELNLSGMKNVTPRRRR